METCTRNFKVINSFLPPTYYVNENIGTKDLESFWNSDRNFKNLSITLSGNSFTKLLQFLMKIGGSVNSLEIKLFTCNKYILDQILGLCQFREKLKVTFMKLFGAAKYFAYSISSMKNLTELKIYKTKKICMDPFGSNFDFKYFTNSKLKKINAGFYKN